MSPIEIVTLFAEFAGIATDVVKAFEKKHPSVCGGNHDEHKQVDKEIDELLLAASSTEPSLPNETF